jgi:hypothetical protein
MSGVAAPIALVALTALLAGCSPVMDAARDTLRLAVRGEPGPDPARLNPGFRYLRVTVGKRVAFLALGNLDPHPRGRVEVWYSGQKEVLRLLDGRVVGATGMTTDWREVELPELPSWSALAASGQPFSWKRKRDVMPGYRLGFEDSLVLRVIPAPERSALTGRDPRALIWFEERRVETPGAGDQALPPARYAVDFSGGRETVVYGEQCLSTELCFTWQRWNIKD